jgi:hypothetical protein
MVTVSAVRAEGIANSESNAIAAVRSFMDGSPAANRDGIRTHLVRFHRTKRPARSPFTRLDINDSSPCD